MKLTKDELFSIFKGEHILRVFNVMRTLNPPAARALTAILVRRAELNVIHINFSWRIFVLDEFLPINGNHFLYERLKCLT